MSLDITIHCTSGPAQTRAQKVAQALGIELRCTPPIPEATGVWRLTATPTHIELCDTVEARVQPLWIDLIGTHARRAQGGQLLLKAVGARNRSVVDASAGLGADAAALAARHEVVAIERSPIVAALLQDALLRARIQDAGMPLFRLILGDARAVLPQLPAPDVVYLDTMFVAKRKKSAAVRKEMRLLRAVVGDDADAEELLQIARGCARDRVVVKRADDAPSLGAAPDFSYRGKLVRYDVYRPRSIG